MREVRTTRSRFLLCELSLVDGDYPKYPPQPVAQCDGYRRKGEAERIQPGDTPGQDT
jgi:hypothetical protein